jgi:hypothetical protein
MEAGGDTIAATIIAVAAFVTWWVVKGEPPGQT